MCSNHISVKTTYLPSSDPSLPALALQVTQLVDSFMLWIGTTDLPPDDVAKAPRQGNLSKDWACAMPAKNPSSIASGAPATSLFRLSASDVALPVAQRLTKRFRKQIFLSVDIPPAFLSASQGSKLLFEMERGVVQILKGIEEENVQAAVENTSNDRKP